MSPLRSVTLRRAWQSLEKHLASVCVLLHAALQGCRAFVNARVTREHCHEYGAESLTNLRPLHSRRTHRNPRTTIKLVPTIKAL